MRKIFSVVLILFVATFSASALFNIPYVGGKYLAEGGANITEVDDPFAVVYNPSGITAINGFALSGSYSEPFGVPGMNLININAAGNIFNILQLGISYIGKGVDLAATSGLREQIISASVAKKFDLSLFILDYISVGASGKMLSLSLGGYEFDSSVNTSINSFNADVGVTISVFDNEAKFAIVGYNLIPLGFVFFSDSTNSTFTYSSLKFGVSTYLVKPYMRLFAAYDLGLNSYSTSSFSVGTEISYADTIFTRIGLLDNKITLGMGLKGPGFEINFGVQNRDNLGWYYQADVTLSFNLF
ncbi:MAG: hypothetical protein ACP5PT_03405 [Brevinematia bacterium]